MNDQPCIPSRIDGAVLCAVVGPVETTNNRYLLYILYITIIHLLLFYTVLHYTKCNRFNWNRKNNVKNVMEQTTIMGQIPMMCLYVYRYLYIKKNKKFLRKKEIKISRDM